MSAPRLSKPRRRRPYTPRLRPLDARQTVNVAVQIEAGFRREIEALMQRQGKDWLALESLTGYHATGLRRSVRGQQKISLQMAVAILIALGAEATMGVKQS